jgi:periplasmic mercuric ion binding protein
MTKKISLFLSLSIFLLLAGKISAQGTITQEIKTKIYCSHCSQCETCGMRFDQELYKLKGFKSFTIVGDVIKVSFNPKKITIDKIRECISNCGYDADDIKATEKGLSSLDGCCRKQE